MDGEWLSTQNCQRSPVRLGVLIGGGILMTEAEMNGNLTDWLVREHVAEMRSQAARRQWRFELKRARSERVASTSAHVRSTEAAVFCHRAAAAACAPASA